MKINTNIFMPTLNSPDGKKSSYFDSEMASLEKQPSVILNLTTESQNRFEDVKSIAKSFNVRSITDDEMIQMSFELYQVGEIDFGQHAILSRHASVNRGDLSAYGNSAAHEEVKPRDYITHFENIIEFEESYGQTEVQLEILKGILKKLENLDEMRTLN